MSTLRLVIDPGHGGDPGAVHNGIREADLVLAIAQDLRHALIASGLDVDVEMTRLRDEAVPHTQRGAISRGFDADLVISLHANANGDPKPKGMMVFYLPAPMKPKDESPEAHARRELREINEPMARAVADAIQEEAPDELKRRLVKGVRNEGYPATSMDWPRVATVLSYHHCPAVLVELGFLTNPDDAAYLENEENHPEIVACLLAGVERAIEMLPERTH